MLRQTLPPTAKRYSRTQRTEIAAATRASLRQWRRVGSDFDAGWASIFPQLMAIVTTAQQRVADGALEYIPDVLEDTGQVDAIDPVAPARSAPLVGVAGDGRPVDSLLYGAVTRAKERVGEGVSTFGALGSSSEWLGMTVGTLLSDTARQAENLRSGTSKRPTGGYVRMLQVPSCSRCVVLAGKWFRSNQGFLRHPRCDCRHIPASESVGGDMAVDSNAYFESLTAEEQDKAFGKAGAEAIRSGADLNQVVNSRRGMSLSQGRLVTTEGTTSRGRAFQQLRSGGTQQELAGTASRLTRTGPEMRVITRTRARTARLMPEQIQMQARGRDEYLALLRANGYLG